MRGPVACRLLALLACLVLLAAASCGDDESEPPAPPPVTDDRPPPAAAVPEIECPPASAGCRTAGGEVLYVERVDPDGDGDAHFVLLSREGITAPGISVIDVRAGLRPQPLPGPGDLMSAAGPVFQGSLGQDQIQADVVAVRRRAH